MENKKTITLNKAGNGIPILQGIHRARKGTIFADSFSYETVLMDLLDIEEMTKKPIFDEYFQDLAQPFRQDLQKGIELSIKKEDAEAIIEIIKKLKGVADSLPASPLASFIITQLAPFVDGVVDWQSKFR